jgi:DNA-binding winged helix-turn-helix (wHTH) protein/uncharacterized protein YeaC (DUF1315 family)
MRLDAVFAADSDPHFYQNLHHYFDLIEKTPELKSLWDESQKEYAEQHTAIWRNRSATDEESDAKAELTNRIERFNLYANGCTIYVRIYLPIEDYKTNTELEDKQDPVALLMLRGINNISTTKWSKDRLKLYNRWYDGKRSMYEQELRQFHLLLLAEFENRKDTKTAESSASFNLDTGVVYIHGVHVTFNPKSQPYRILSTLWKSKNHQATFDELLRVLHPNSRRNTKACKADLYKVVRNIRRALGVLPERDGGTSNIVENIPRYGYRLVLSDKITGEKT